ncbi:MAG: uncharacterized membrane protein YgdD (TMEM256/DUF423 family) [Candidatus Latescibacterota bacterium]|jgi:uncharacterized membrane protein YgdD (TMEM256/DUF423 family)
MSRLFFGLGAGFAFLGVMLGAFGAHALRNKLEPRMLEVFETGVRYQMYHAFALIVTAWAVSQWPGGVTQIAGWFFVAGIVVFSGSLYGLTLTGMRGLGAITPLGGLMFLAGWLCLVWAAIKS